LTQEEFDNISCKFISEYDPKIKGAIDQTWDKSAFKEFTGTEDSLLKLCAKAKIDRCKNDEHRIALST